MGRKKYYGFKKPMEYYSVTFQDDSWDKRASMGTLLVAGFLNGKFYMVKTNWGAEDDYARSREGEVEMNWHFDEENTKKMMLRTGTHNGWDLLQTIYNRYKQHRGDADEYITRWCDEKDIEYSYAVFY